MRHTDVYRGLASLLDAGVVIGEACGQLHKNGTLPDGVGRDLTARVTRGETLAGALAHHPDAFPGEDVALVEAGETSGRLVESLERMADLRDERRRSVRTLLTAAAYPLILFHVAALLMPTARLGLANKLTLGNWLASVLMILGPAYAIGFLVWHLNKRATWRSRFRRLIDVLPGFGSAARHQRRALFATVLGAAYQSGIPVNRALTLAGRATHDPRADTAALAVAGGQQLTGALIPTSIFDPPTLSQIASAEQAGQLSETLTHIAAEEDERAKHTFQRTMVVAGVVLYLAVALWIAWFVISFYTNLPGYR